MILRAVARAKYRSTIDLSNWYFQVRVSPEDEKYNTIKTPFGSFACRVMLQGDTNAPATAMRVIEHVLDGLIGKNVWAYLDDITIFSDTQGDHIPDVREVCQTLQQHKIRASPKKCNFFAEKLTLLGHVIDDQGIHADPEKIRGIQDWFTPKSKKELQKFIGVVIYHAQFLPHLSTALAPLSDLTSQEVFEWRPLHEEAFQQVKRLASTTIPLRPVNYSSPETIYLITDASKVGAGAWVGQGTSPEKVYPAAFHSRKFATSQLHYPVHELELLAVVDAIQAFHPILYNTQFTVVTDNKELSYFLSQTDLPFRQTRWRMYLQFFDFDIIHMPGKDNILADALSRIYEERPAELDQVLVDPTEKKSIRSPSSAMTNTTKHYLELTDTLNPALHTTLPIPFQDDPTAPKYLSMWNSGNGTTPLFRQEEDENRPSSFEQSLVHADTTIQQATNIIQSCEITPEASNIHDETPETAEITLPLQQAQSQLSGLASRIHSPAHHME